MGGNRELCTQNRENWALWTYWSCHDFREQKPRRNDSARLEGASLRGWAKRATFPATARIARFWTSSRGDWWCQRVCLLWWSGPSYCCLPQTREHTPKDASI